MTQNLQLNFRTSIPSTLASASDSDDEFKWWREEIKKPEYRLKIWAYLALAAAFVGDEERMNEYAALAEREKTTIASRQNT